MIAWMSADLLSIGTQGGKTSIKFQLNDNNRPSFVENILANILSKLSAFLTDNGAIEFVKLAVSIQIIQINSNPSDKKNHQLECVWHDRYIPGPLLLTWFNFNPSMDK